VTPEDFITELSQVKLDAVFNPYSECCPVYDLPESPECRRDNLASVLRAAWKMQGCSLWIARDLGYRGGRRTGLPLTDEVHLAHFSQAWGGLPLRKATVGPPVAERTAAVIWSMLQRLQQQVLLWNLFPLHPHQDDDPMSNRIHTTAERRIGEIFLIKLLSEVKPGKIVAIGGDAALTLLRLGIPHVRVRHPSYGGQQEFYKGIGAAYGLLSDSLDVRMQLNL